MIDAQQILTIGHSLGNEMHGLILPNGEKGVTRSPKKTSGIAPEERFPNMNRGEI
jgi:hypothetical protein